MQPTTKKPSLGGSADTPETRHVARDGSHRILDKLAHAEPPSSVLAKGRERWRLAGSDGRRTPAIAVLGLLCCALGWLAYHSMSDLTSHDIPVTVIAAPHATRPEPAASPAPTLSSAMPAAAPAAAIINDVASPATAAIEARPASVAEANSVTAAGTVPPNPSQPSSSATTVHPTLAGPTSTLQPDGDASSRVSPTHAAQVGKNRSGVPHRVAASGKAPAHIQGKPGNLLPALATSSPAPAAENDVALIAAVVAHSSHQALASATDGAPELVPSRDVILRADGDATATLLQRCRQLGAVESRLCRARICSGRWKRDAACR